MMMNKKEYLYDTAQAERTIRDFMNITLRELKDKYTEKYLDDITKAVIPGEGLSEDKMQDMSYIELACLVNNAGGNPKYDQSDYDSYAKQKIYYKCLAHILLEKSKDSIPVKLFTEIPVKNFFDCLSGIVSSGESPFRFYKKIARFSLKAGCTVATDNRKKGDDYTIKEFLQEKCELKAYSDAGSLLVDSLLLAFPDRSHVEDIRKKYSAFEKDEIQAVT